MTNEEAARILDPETSLDVYAEKEYYSGFEGAERWKESVDEACIMGAKALREQSATDINVDIKEQDKELCECCGLHEDDFDKPRTKIYRSILEYYEVGDGFPQFTQFRFCPMCGKSLCGKSLPYEW